MQIKTMVSETPDSRGQNASNLDRGTFALVDRAALMHNLTRVRQLAPGCSVMVVVKANAYGHGIERVASALHGAEAMAVATIGEARRVRAVDGQQRLVLLEGVLTAEQLDMADELGLDTVVHSRYQIEMLCRRSFGGRIWIKFDTGMHRLGFPLEDATAVVSELRSLGFSNLGLMSHLANADDLDDRKTGDQIARFENVRARFPELPGSLANSAGIVGWKASHHDWVRAGLAVYGVSPMLDADSSKHHLRPAMSLYSSIIAVNHCRAGDQLGYGSAYECPADMPVGMVGIGYGDGYPRRADTGTPVLVNDTRCPLVGRVSMDMLAIDLRGAPDTAVGDRVELWGNRLPVEEIARCAGTIPYELLCSVTARVPTFDA